jgi:predicted enzyme related to lactoylglutathione lyase
MSENGKPAGGFVWHDLMTTDLDRSIAFYGTLFGWTFETAPLGEGPDYTVIQAAGRPIGGIVPQQESDGIPSHWIGYVAVDDVDATVAAAESAGGVAPIPGTDIPSVGRFAVIAGPHGGTVSPFRSLEKNVDEPSGPPVPGVFCWDQLVARDPESSARYYEAVFGWEVVGKDVEGAGHHWVFQSDGRDRAGMIQAPPHGEDHPDFWLAYVEVADVAAAARKAADLGGEILMPPTDIPGVGRFAITADPTGALLALSTQRA